ncbi:TIGR02281 family clan AA aspartic protease [Rhodobacter capsulatus]|uniref:Aspartyl protease family protein n=1 Tax=Rhodobacter capsulatus TaxID=1061 RepID=A0A1G7S689_RHOCA|nr:TIGR02281 family clan AA aspartic protease [Rhodobacter capsulatus]WER08017.1 TIGR02281 family clan AA aspartic protease [Rhodobacter capsulatus]SDG18537.1 aspartyl protease family protein [Rhodobacter capsulatus]
MDPDIPRVIYYLLLLLAIGGYLVAALRRRPGQALQQLMIWALIFLGVAAVAGIWPDVRAAIAPAQTVTQSGRIELPLRADGHYYLQAQVNGATIDFVIDTGASQIVLSRADAERAGIDTGALAYIGRAFTANGEVATAPVRLDSLSVGPFTDRDVAAVVNRGAMEGSLLGMSYLTRFGKVQFDDRRMILER